MRWPTVLVLAVALMLANRAAWSADRDVPSRYHTIQQALDASSAGDVVRVAPGIYHENLTIHSGHDGVRLASVAGPLLTVIDGGRPQPSRVRTSPTT